MTLIPMPQKSQILTKSCKDVQRIPRCESHQSSINMYSLLVKQKNMYIIWNNLKIDTNRKQIKGSLPLGPRAWECTELFLERYVHFYPSMANFTVPF